MSAILVAVLHDDTPPPPPPPPPKKNISAWRPYIFRGIFY